MSWLLWPARWAWFLAWFAWLVVTSNFTVIVDTLTPGQRSRPVVARYQSRCRSDAETWLLGAAVTLTPGTLTLGVRSAEGAPPMLYVHAMYETPDELVGSVGKIEDMLLRATRREVRA